MSEKTLSWGMLLSTVLPAVTVAGILACCTFMYGMIIKINSIEKILIQLEMHNLRITKLERSTIDIQTIDRIATALDNAEIDGQANFATKAVSRALKLEAALKREFR